MVNKKQELNRADWGVGDSYPLAKRKEFTRVSSPPWGLNSTPGPGKKDFLEEGGDGKR